MRSQRGHSLRSRAGRAATWVLLLLAATGSFAGPNRVAETPASIGSAHHLELHRIVLDARRERLDPLQLAAVRRDYFAAIGRPGEVDDHRFANALADEDLHRLQLALVGERAVVPSPGPAWLAGHADPLGDVPHAVRPSLRQWLDGVRRTLRRAGALDGLDARAPTRAMVAGGLKANQHLYQTYKRDRDAFEFRRHALQQTVERVRRSPHGLPLVHQVVVRFDPRQDTRHVLLRGNRTLRLQADRVAKSGAKVLRCRYGPADLWADGSPRYEERQLWYQRAPEQMGALVAVDHEGALGTLRTATAHVACPASDRVSTPRHPVIAAID
jgi:hypothetical protein